MSPTTGIVLIGSNHPNEQNICPTHVAILDEHFRARWTLTDLSGQHPNAELTPQSPSKILDGLFELIAQHVITHTSHRSEAVEDECPATRSPRREYPGMALSFTTFNNCSIADHLDELKGLRHTAIQISELTWQRQWSMWTGEWEISD